VDLASIPVTVLRGVGPKLADKLARLHLHSVQDLLFHLPLRYQDRTRVVPIGRLQRGLEALVVGKIELTDAGYRGKRNLLCRISDGTGFVTLRFFHFSALQQQKLQRGRSVRAYGEVRFGPAGLEMAHPEYSVCEDEAEPEPEPYLTPVYPTTEGLHQQSLRRLIEQTLERYLEPLREWLPPELMTELGLPNIRDALREIHRPPDTTTADLITRGRHGGRERLAFEELLAHHLSLRRLRKQEQSHAAPILASHGALLDALLAHLPFKLTRAQLHVIDELRQDLRQPVPMQRLLQGDVGSGKTVVAAAATTCAVETGYQVAVMAPTEILAEQHARNFAEWLAPLGVEVVTLLSRLSSKMRADALEALASTQPVVAVGTHALFQEGVTFGDLGLLIIDEQHRFGVHQRLALREKGAHGNRHPHQLVMTATPIPRTLAQTVYADLDVSIIDELPPGRQAVETVAMPASRRAEVVERIRSACLAGRQAYWVCPLIDESDHLQLQTATDTQTRLQQVLPELRISLVHGRMKPAARDETMNAFKAGTVDLLVATTVVEVGVDVANASLMIIENTERLGLSQLHQLRGRVGRGSEQSSCVLLYQPPLSAQARDRIAALRESNDGFEIARRDLAMRGPGELLGTRQTGIAHLRIADLARDQKLLSRVQRVAELLLQQYPQHADRIIQRWVQQGEDYANV
jgi:ATP-dependent DNA helicase RecG